MSYHLVPVPLYVIGIVVYWIARRKNMLKVIAVVQPLNTVLAILIAVLSLFTPHAHTCFTAWIIAGLVISLIGDINNVDMADQKTVIIGLVIFVFAYLTYAVGMTIFNGFHAQDLVVGVILIIIYIAVIAIFWPGLGEMRVPVMIYALIMPFMVSRAISTLFGDFFSLPQAILLSAGTGMLYIGDLEFGIHLFRKPIPMHFGPILYAGGQLLISLSPSYFSG
jgi:uncharacterized membrane protein YhhN